MYYSFGLLLEKWGVPADINTTWQGNIPPAIPFLETRCVVAKTALAVRAGTRFMHFKQNPCFMI